MVPVQLLDGSLIQPISSVPNHYDEDWGSDECEHEVGHLIPPNVFLAIQCSATQAEIQTIPLIASMSNGRFSRKLLILYT